MIAESTKLAADAAADQSPAAMAARLEAHLARLDAPTIVAFSGGVDSSVVAVSAHRALGERMVAITASTESNTADDIAETKALAARFGFAHEVISYSELAIPNYAANPTNRCFFCKNELYTRLGALAKTRGVAHVCDGSNLDDMGDYRPGLQAVARHGVRSPLREVGLTKAMVRAVALHYGLPNHDKPAAPCLSSRIPYGSPVTREKLDQVARAEAALRALGLVEFRCRHHGDIARIEASPADFPRLLDAREEILTALRAIGFHWVALDLAGFRSGSLNRVVVANNPPTPHSPTETA